MTGAGGRLLATRPAAPLAALERIRRRLDAVQALLDAPALRADLRTALRGCPDLERALSRLSLGRASADLHAMREGLQRAAEIKARLADDDCPLAASARGSRISLTWRAGSTMPWWTARRFSRATAD